MIKYFSGHTEVSWSKSMRATYDHQGLSESRVASHNSHFGMRDMNKRDITFFPFKFLSMKRVLPPDGISLFSPRCTACRLRCCVRADGMPLTCTDIADKHKVDYPADY